jgi:acyl-ACP thioesterase
VPVPAHGRRFTTRRRVRLGDAKVSGRLRLDALARYLQDVATDDADDAGISGAWVLRRIALRVDRLPRFREDVELVTFCGGTGSRWAERRTQVLVDGRVAVESAALWVFVDERGRPIRLAPQFFERYGETAGGRTITSRLQLPRHPDGIEARPWPTRTSDFDVLGHMNNAAHWEAVEHELARTVSSGRVATAEVEYRDAIDPGDAVTLASELDVGQLRVWLLVDGVSRCAARVTLAPSIS